MVDRACYIKEPGKIKLMRQAAAMADAGIKCVRDAIHIGITETEIAGIGDIELSRFDSEYHWAITGSSEVASAYRAIYGMNGTTQPTQKMVQKGENIILDLHPLYQLYSSDLVHNFILGKLVDAFLTLEDDEKHERSNSLQMR